MTTIPVQTQRWKEAARPPATAAAAAWGRLTAGARMTPDFLIVGAQRCGTTSMYRALVQHAAVLRPPLRKGIHYFDTGYGHGPAWYAAHFPLRATAAVVQRRAGVPAVTFESSPYYMFHPRAGERIARELPDVRLLVLLRDPVERAYSAHSHELARGFETEPFERALELEQQRLDGVEQQLRDGEVGYSFSHQHHAYVKRGEYIDQLTRLEDVFGRARLHVVDSQDFFDDPAPVFGEVLDFLGLPHRVGTRFEKHNARSRAPMGDALRARLHEHYQPYDERLADWLGWTPSWMR